MLFAVSKNQFAGKEILFTLSSRPERRDHLSWPH
jgi:hypothetical protein